MSFHGPRSHLEESGLLDIALSLYKATCLLQESTVCSIATRSYAIYLVLNSAHGAAVCLTPDFLGKKEAGFVPMRCQYCRAISRQRHPMHGSKRTAGEDASTTPAMGLSSASSAGNEICHTRRPRQIHVTTAMFGIGTNAAC